MGQYEEPRTISVEMGSTETWIFLIEDLGVMGCEVVPIGGDDVDAAIASHVRTSESVQIGPRTAEALKLRLGAPDEVIGVKGRRLSTGEPATADVALSSIHGAALEAMAPAMRKVAACQEEWGIRDEDVELEGGGALLPGLFEMVRGNAREVAGEKHR